jgi:hypothetical protein
MRVVRLLDDPDWRSRLLPIEEIFFATSPSAKTLRPDERPPFKERWLGRYIANDIESFFVAITRARDQDGCFGPKADSCTAANNRRSRIDAGEFRRELGLARQNRFLAQKNKRPSDTI